MDGCWVVVQCRRSRVRSGATAEAVEPVRFMNVHAPTAVVVVFGVGPLSMLGVAAMALQTVDGSYNVQSRCLGTALLCCLHWIVLLALEGLPGQLCQLLVHCGCCGLHVLGVRCTCHTQQEAPLAGRGT